MAAEITKTQFVLKRSQFGYTDYANFIPFDAQNEETGVVDRTVVLARRIVDDLGWPEEITVTVEPGDTLNG